MGLGIQSPFETIQEAVSELHEAWECTSCFLKVWETGLSRAKTQAGSMGSLSPLKNSLEVCKLKKQYGGQETTAAPPRRTRKKPQATIDKSQHHFLSRLLFPDATRGKTSWAFCNMHTGKLFPTAGRQRILGLLDGSSSFEGKTLWGLALQSGFPPAQKALTFSSAWNLATVRLWSMMYVCPSHAQATTSSCPLPCRNQSTEYYTGVTYSQGQPRIFLVGSETQHWCLDVTSGYLIQIFCTWSSFLFYMAILTYSKRFQTIRVLAVSKTIQLCSKTEKQLGDKGLWMDKWMLGLTGRHSSTSCSWADWPECTVYCYSQNTLSSWDNPSLFQLSHTPSALPKFICTKPCWVFVCISPSLTQILTVTSSFSRAKSWWSTWTDQSSLSAPSISFSVPEERKKQLSWKQ